MSQYIVLVKQVPDVSQITDNAFDPETGNLIRTRLPSVINELDAQALAFARHMKEISADTQGKIIALSMGPPMAEEVLRYSLSRCADEVILLTDRALGGADTVATANPLAHAVRRIVTEKLGGAQDYYVIAGMQSVDGDTAQVPAQLAEELRLPCIAYVTEADFTGGKFRFTRIISGGSQVVETRTLPAVLTVAKYEYPVFASFGRTRWAAKTPLAVWTAKDIQANYIGVAGSKTRVIRVFPPGKTSRKCKHVADAKELARMIVESATAKVNAKETEADKKRHYLLPADRSDCFDRSFEGIEKEAHDFQTLRRILGELGIKDVGQIDEPMQEKIIEKAAGAFHKKALEDILGGF